MLSVERKSRKNLIGFNLQMSQRVTLDARVVRINCQTSEHRQANHENVAKHGQEHCELRLAHRADVCVALKRRLMERIGAALVDDTAHHKIPECETDGGVKTPPVNNTVLVVTTLVSYFLALI